MKEYRRLTKRLENGKIISADIELACHPKGIKDAMIERLAELEDAIESGKLVRLPCEVGDTVYVITSSCFRCNKNDDYCKCEYRNTNKIIETTIKSIAIDENDYFITEDRLGECGMCSIHRYGKSLGKTWFTDKAQAEAKLKELEGKK